MFNIKNQYDVGSTLSNYPKAKETLKNWVREQLAEVQAFMYKEAKLDPKEAKIPEIADEQLESTIAGYFTYNARGLYEFFDSQGILIEIFQANKEASKFGYQVDNQVATETYNSRFDAEKAAFDASFDLLERTNRNY